MPGLPCMKRNHYGLTDPCADEVHLAPGRSRYVKSAHHSRHRNGADFLTIRCTLAIAVLACFFLAAACAHGHDHHRNNAGSRRLQRHNQRVPKRPTTYLNQIIVKLASQNDQLAAALADRYGLTFKRRIESLNGWYLFEDKRIRKRSVTAPHLPISMHRLQRDRQVIVAERLKVLRRIRRNRLETLTHDQNAPATNPNDPAWRQMWYMHCGGANNSDCPTSMRISDSWRAGYAGTGVVVTILDDGIEKNHPDLRYNYDANASRDINSGDADPTPRYDLTNENKHGTRCAGVVAAVSGNNICSVGIAYRAKIGGIRMLDGEVTDEVEAESLSYNRDYIDIYSASWGPDDDGNTVEGPGDAAKDAFESGAKYGRGGKGSIFVWASGNGGHNKDSCACDGYINSIYTIAISSVSQNGRRPWYLESCASTLATTYSSGEINEGKIITTDLHGRCTYQHTGTSASAPMAAGVIALMLEANENLTWRDVQHIIVRTSNPNGLQAPDWTTNGAGYRVSHVFGFGLMDALQLSHVSKNWETVPEQRRCENPMNDLFHNSRDRWRNVTSTGVELASEGCAGTASEVNYIEHVILRISLSLSHSNRGDLRIVLTSPHGTISNILERRSLDKSKEGFNNWDFMTTHHWGENPRGRWQLSIRDYSRQRHKLTRNTDHGNQLLNWQLIFYGTREDPQTNFSLNACDAYPQHQCHPECNGCCGATALECKTCKHVSTSAGVCIPSCPSGNFPHHSSNICQPCWGTCTECSGPLATDCTACRIGFSLVDGRCTQQCSRGSFLDSVTQRCISCHQSCKTCTRRRDICTTCKDGFRKVGDSCEASCPPGTYIASYQIGCAFCNENCKECIGPSAGQCTECRDGMILNGRRCVATCPKRMYYNEEQRRCQTCHKNCKTCDGPSAQDCVTCEANHELREGECRKPCRDDYNRSNFSSNPCLLIVKLNMCQFEALREMCCQACSTYETGELFLPTDLSIAQDDVTLGPDYYGSIEEYGESDPLSIYHEFGDYGQDTEAPVNAEPQLETGKEQQADSETPIIVESGVHLEESRGIQRSSDNQQ